MCEYLIILWCILAMNMNLCSSQKSQTAKTKREQKANSSHKLPLYAAWNWGIIFKFYFFLTDRPLAINLCVYWTFRRYQ